MESGRSRGRVLPADYYAHLRRELTRPELFAAHPLEALAAQTEALHAELGVMDRAALRSRIRTALAGADPWVLIGGPPCQAYSLVGRARNRGIRGYSLDADPKARLYLEYLRILADHWPAAFVMENVRGLLSARLGNEPVFDRLCADLQDPAAALGVPRAHTYTLHALASDSLVPARPSDFVIRSERHGLPQCRHRVIWTTSSYDALALAW